MNKNMVDPITEEINARVSKVTGNSVSKKKRKRPVNWLSLIIIISVVSSLITALF
ncbi:hypothetical protein LTA00_13465 [Lactiplantibacillus plantarum]|uniref:hypothetical protein n=1 Tax=Lactiplantibacillus plantarum TaxID=1590 RepID=UPI002004EE56|nr:hypothetical protein [Lactiplantibacillus plantarum]MCK6240588.1 hypothetical protein [Lactiplantibacillus plantarum]